MTDRERLIELMQKCDIVQIQTSKFIEGFADYLLEHGVIVLPCKVGDTVYAYDVYFYEIHDFRITQKVLYDGAPTIYTGECRNGDVMLSDITFTDSDIGKSVFLTREEAEEAEKALKEREQ